MAYARPVSQPRLHRIAGVQRVIGLLLMIFSTSMLPPLAVSLWYADGVEWAFMSGAWITFTTGYLVWRPVKDSRGELKLRDGFIVVVMFWAVLSAFGTIPLYVTDLGWHSFVDALFESVSGLTTTGATVVPSGLDELPRSLLYYRAQLHWLGGMGIIVLAVAVLPMLGVGGMQLYKAETPGPMKDAKLTPRIAETARALWIVYFTLTLVCTLAYWAAGMSLFDAICHAMSTLATGGFSTHDASIGHYNDPGLEWLVMLFMFLGTVNFATHFMVWRQRNPLVYWRDAELRTSMTIIASFTLLICLPLLMAATYPDLATTVRKALFQVISYGTTTGFATADPTAWPSYTPLVLMLCGFMVGCAGSTSGGVKVVRLMLFVKQAFREMHGLIHPSAELPIKLQGKVVPDAIVHAVGAFFSVYIGATIILTLVMMATGLEAVTAFSAVAACINNMGPGLGHLNTSMAEVSDAGKWVLIFTMLLGRLEIFSLLIIFTPTFWRR